MTTLESIDLTIQYGAAVLRVDIVSGEQLISEAEALLPTLLTEHPAEYPRAVQALDKIWSDHVMNVLMFDEAAS